MSCTVEVIVGGKTYRLTTEEGDREQTEKIAAFVDKKYREFCGGTELAATDALFLTAVNIADEYFKSVAQAESLREQLQSCIAQMSRARGELADARRELSRLKNKSKSAAKDSEPQTDA